MEANLPEDEGLVSSGDCNMTCVAAAFPVCKKRLLSGSETFVSSFPVQYGRPIFALQEVSEEALIILQALSAKLLLMALWTDY